MFSIHYEGWDERVDLGRDGVLALLTRLDEIDSIRVSSVTGIGFKEMDSVLRVLVEHLRSTTRE